MNIQVENKNKPSSQLGTDNLDLALTILDEAEEAFQAKSMAEERALSENYPPPASIGDYLFWIENEAALQQKKIRLHPKGARRQQSYTRALRGIAGELRELGFIPSPAPCVNRQPV